MLLLEDLLHMQPEQSNARGPAAPYRYGRPFRRRGRPHVELDIRPCARGGNRPASLTSWRWSWPWSEPGPPWRRSPLGAARPTTAAPRSSEPAVPFRLPASGHGGADRSEDQTHSPSAPAGEVGTEAQESCPTGPGRYPQAAAFRPAVEIGSPLPPWWSGNSGRPAGLGVTALSSPEQVTKDTLRDRSSGLSQVNPDICDAAHITPRRMTQASTRQ